MDNERDFIIRLKEGDQNAFEQLVRENQNNIFKIALSLVKNVEDAEDIAQDVFIKIYNAINSFNGQSTISTWIYRITYNVSLDFLKKHGKKAKVTKTLDDPEDYEVLSIEGNTFIPDAMFELKETREDIKDALSQISEEQRQLIELKDVHGFSYEEIISMTGLKDGTLKSRLSRGRQALKDILIKKWNI